LEKPGICGQKVSKQNLGVSLGALRDLKSRGQWSEDEDERGCKKRIGIALFPGGRAEGSVYSG
jgi:hypothetical protein